MTSLFGVAILAGVLSMPILVIATEAGGEASVRGNSWDFGSVPSDFKLIHFYEIENDGADSLRILRVNPNCDCTYAHVRDSIVPPGGGTNLKITYNTRDFYGKNTKTVIVETSDSENPILEFEYSANIEYFHKLHTVEPKYLTFLKGQENRTVQLVNHSDNSVDFEIHQEPDGLFSIDKYSGSIKPNQNEPLSVSVNKNLSKGTFYSNFTVTYATQPPLKLSVPVKIVRY